MALMAAGIGAVGSIAGGLLGGKPKAPKYTPYDVYSPFGTVDYDKKGRTIKSTLSPEQQQFADLYGGMARTYMAGGPYAETSQWATGAAGGALPGLFEGALAGSATDPYSLAAYQGALNPMQRMSMMAGMNMLGGPIAGQEQAMQMFQQGQNLLGSAPQSYQDVFDQRLGLLREQAAPFEQRASDSMFNRLFSQGRLGSTGGGRDIEAFARGLGQADTTRQLDAMNLSEALYGRDLSAALQNRSIGSGLMGSGLQGLISAPGQQISNAYNMFGLSGNLAGQQYGAAQGYNELVNSRAQQRMSNAMGLFGFGAGINADSLKQGLGLQDAQSSLFANLQNTGQAGHASGMGVAGAGGSTPPAWQTALGGALQGLGGSMMSNPSAWGGVFGFGQPKTGTPFNINNGNYNIAPLPAFNPASVPQPTFFNFGQ